MDCKTFQTIWWKERVSPQLRNKSTTYRLTASSAILTPKSHSVIAISVERLPESRKRELMRLYQGVIVPYIAQHVLIIGWIARTTLEQPYRSGGWLECAYNPKLLLLERLIEWNYYRFDQRQIKTDRIQTIYVISGSLVELYLASLWLDLENVALPEICYLKGIRPLFIITYVNNEVLRFMGF